MPKLKLDGIGGMLDGEYELPTMADLTNRELHYIRQTCGLSPAGVVGGIFERDAGLAVALAAVTLLRGEKQFDVDALWDAAAGSIVYDFSDMKVETADPPEQPSSDESEPVSPGGTSDESETSGSDSEQPSESPE